MARNGKLGEVRGFEKMCIFVETLRKMAAIRQLRVLDDFVSDFLDKETYGLILSEKEYQKELDSMYETSERTIREHIENYVQDIVLKEDCDVALDDFQNNLKRVQTQIEALSAKSESVRSSLSATDSDTEQDRAQMAFCEKLVVFLRDLISRVEEWKGGSLSAQEANEENFFLDLRVGEEQLPQIYRNLLDKGWIVRSRTSLNNFIYYFTGKGIIPQNPIRWKSTEPILTLFLECMTLEEKKWAKAALIFEKRKRGTQTYHPVNKDNLGVSRSKVKNNENFQLLVREVMRDIMGYHNWEEKAKDYHLIQNG